MSYSFILQYIINLLSVCIYTCFFTFSFLQIASSSVFCVSEEAAELYWTHNGDLASKSYLLNKYKVIVQQY